MEANGVEKGRETELYHRKGKSQKEGGGEGAGPRVESRDSVE